MAIPALPLVPVVPVVDCKIKLSDKYRAVPGCVTSAFDGGALAVSDLELF